MSESEGDKLWKSAKKLTSPSLMSFRMKSDWEQAGPLYDKAALCFRVGKFLLSYSCNEVDFTCSGAEWQWTQI